MIIYQQNNIAAFAGNIITLWVLQPILHQRISATSAAPSDQLIAQSRSTFRFVFSRLFGRVN